MTPEVVQHGNEEATRDLLVGRRIVSAETGEFETPAGCYGNAEGRLTLDDGTTILVAPNEGCGGCSNGWYHLAHLAATDNAITDVRLVVEGEPDEYGEGPQSYRIYVVADNTEINAVQVDGDDGNGYYGSGYELFVIAPSVRG